MPRAGTARPLGEGSEGRTGSPGKERRGGTRLPSGVSRTGTQPGELPLSAGRLREEPRPLRPSNQGAPARPERKALWDGGGKRGGRRVAEATGGVAAGRTGPDRSGPGPTGSEREGGGGGPRRAWVKRLGAELGERELRWPSGTTTSYIPVARCPLYSEQQLPVPIVCLGKTRWFPPPNLPWSVGKGSYRPTR